MPRGRPRLYKTAKTLRLHNPELIDTFRHQMAWLQEHYEKHGRVMAHEYLPHPRDWRQCPDGDAVSHMIFLAVWMLEHHINGIDPTTQPMPFEPADDDDDH